MRVLTTFPGRAGDILWCLPSVRALAETLGDPVDFCVAGEFASMVPLLEQQSYLGKVWADPAWSLSQPDDWRMPEDYDWCFPLGYRRWPELPLPFETYGVLSQIWEESHRTSSLALLNLDRPWITVPKRIYGHTVACGWSDCYFELKFGLMELLFPTPNEDRRKVVSWTALGLIPSGSRWDTEGGYQPSSWLEAAVDIQAARVFLGDCSALHVLAVALGKPAVIVEPMPARLNDIFWPLGKNGPRVTLVRGLDGESTFDSRHTADTLREALAHV